MHIRAISRLLQLARSLAIRSATLPQPDRRLHSVLQVSPSLSQPYPPSSFPHFWNSRRSVHILGNQIDLLDASWRRVTPFLQLIPGSALYIFAPTGPAFGTFSLSLDGQDKGRYNASTTLDTYDTLLYFVSGLADATHSVVMTNMDQGMLLALDYIVAVSGTGLTTPGQIGPVPPNAIVTAVAGTTTLLNPTATNVGAIPTAVFPGQTTGTDRGNNGAAGLAIGLTLGILAAIVSL